MGTVDITAHMLYTDSSFFLLPSSSVTRLQGSRHVEGENKGAVSVAVEEWNEGGAGGQGLQKS